MFHYFKTPHIICTFFAKFVYNENTRPYFLLHIVLTIFASDHPVEWMYHDIIRCLVWMNLLVLKKLENVIITLSMTKMMRDCSLRFLHYIVNPNSVHHVQSIKDRRKIANGKNQTNKIVVRLSIARLPHYRYSEKKTSCFMVLEPLGWRVLHMSGWICAIVLMMWSDEIFFFFFFGYDYIALLD